MPIDDSLFTIIWKLLKQYSPQKQVPFAVVEITVLMVHNFWFKIIESYTK